MQTEQWYADRTWETRAWVDGRRDPKIEQWANVDEAMAMAEAGMKHRNSDSIARLEIVGSCFVGGKRHETLLHRWNQDFKTGKFKHTVAEAWNNDGTRMLPSSMPSVEIQ